jgi:hypothetical protein
MARSPRTIRLRQVLDAPAASLAPAPAVDHRRSRRRSTRGASAVSTRIRATVTIWRCTAWRCAMIMITAICSPKRSNRTEKSRNIVGCS